MTPEERAAQIWCKPYMASKKMDVELCSLIAAEIRAAVEEAYKEARLYNEVIGEAREAGKAEAYEDAAKIAEECDHDGECVYSDCHIGAAKAIRARAREA